MANNVDLCLWLRCAGDDQALYDSTLGQYDTDFPRDAERATSAPRRTETPDGYGTDGRSDKGVPGGSTTVTKEQMPFAPHDSTGWTSGLRPTTEPEQIYSDSDKSPAKEGESWGLTPSYSAAETMINFFGKRSAAVSREWVLSSRTSFSTFVSAAPELLEAHKAAGVERSAAVAAVAAEFPALFAKFPWAPRLLDRFADRVFGTAASVKCECESVASAIDTCVDTELRKGASRANIESTLSTEFQGWIENDPAVPLYIKACLDMRFVSANKSPAAGHVDLLLSEHAELPISYAEFRSWCRGKNISASAYVDLERTAVEMNFISIPDMLEIVAEKSTYISDTTSPTPKIKTVEVPAGQTAPESVKDADGTELKKADLK